MLAGHQETKDKGSEVNSIYFLLTVYPDVVDEASMCYYFQLVAYFLHYIRTLMKRLCMLLFKKRIWFIFSLSLLSSLVPPPPETPPAAELQHPDGAGRRPQPQLHIPAEGDPLPPGPRGHQGGSAHLQSSRMVEPSFVKLGSMRTHQKHTICLRWCEFDLIWFDLSLFWT